ncbi:RNB domain-containing ribonuclease [Cellulosimicrobium protaetiae]|uniref:RNB domain-containing ribonuclease n=2 Tax=Cellulosimicrobium protaetiae TaxID=2587808 RepID=A0A6M5UKS7_9MICO|nr:RNB domain-containing ribonuclease [Cellulosimicrobium protaetiae]QJW38634.1 RNB domain-containing ribonuclease [Cellulosimicrobium protaetiae]
MEVPGSFPDAVLAEAEAVVRVDRAVVGDGRTDLRDVPFVTIDPPGSMDLDQALHLERAGASSADPAGAAFVVHYAIADVGAFVEPGGAIDAEVHERGTTLYAPDARTPLHPAVLSEGAASLLPDEDRPAAAWRIVLDARGEILDATVRRAVVRSTRRLTYDEAQARIDAPDPDAGALLLLREVGELRLARERDRGGVSLEVPEQEIVPHDDGTFGLEFRSTLPAEAWNAQISLLTGIAAARLMRAGGVGVFRALPAADPRDLSRLRRTAHALGIDWPRETPYAELVPTLDSRVPRHAAFLNEATSLFRGASYEAFGGTGQEPGVPDDAAHAAIGAEYSHVTAPLRRLVDRYGTEVCLALCADEEVPRWVLDALPGLPRTMARTGQRAGSYERAIVDVVEAALLAGREGQEFDGVVVDVEDDRERTRRLDREGGGGTGTRRGQVVLADPAVRAPVEGTDLPLGDPVRVTLREASVTARRVRFTVG